MRTLTILVDLDAIAADMLKKWLEDYNYEWANNASEELTVDNITTFHLEDHVKPAAKGSGYAILEQPGFYRDLEPIPGAQDVMAKWRAQGHQAVFCSSPPTPHGAAEKYQWVVNRFGHAGYTRKDIILANKKDLVWGDVLIDDYHKNVVEWRARWKLGHALTIGYPYTQESAYHMVAGSYHHAELAWWQLDAYIQALAE